MKRERAVISLRARDLRDLTDDELEHRLADTRQELFNLRFQAATGALENSARLKLAKREIARILTVQPPEGIRQAEGAELDGRRREERRDEETPVERPAGPVGDARGVRHLRGAAVGSRGRGRGACGGAGGCQSPSRLRPETAPEPEAAPRPPAAGRPHVAPARAARRSGASAPKVVREKPKTRKPITRTEKPEGERGRRQERRGVVVSDKGDKTIIVKVDVIKSHPRYKKVVRRP